jgi:hypothetical protein
MQYKPDEFLRVFLTTPSPSPLKDMQKHRETAEIEIMLHDTTDGVATISLQEEKREKDPSSFDVRSELAAAPSDIQQLSRLFQEYLYSRDTEYTPSLKDIALQLMKDALLEQFTQKFQRIQDEEWSANLRSHGNDPSASGSRSSSSQSYPSSARCTDEIAPNGRKRAREGEGSDDEVQSDGEDKGPPKRSGKGKSKKKGESRPFACPFRKQNPVKYNLHNWNTCATSSWEEIPRLK